MMPGKVSSLMETQHNMDKMSWEGNFGEKHEKLGQQWKPV